ncbi:MAG: cholesterol transport system auxiliary component [Thermodesulfobacteriota bacterium]|nr:cholesterol transport system auxiliary component [Thermodesulfobacteriota bacterium]
MNIKQVFLFLAVIAMAGCLGGSRSAAVVQYYHLEYGAPGFANLAPCPQAIRVERLTANRAFDSRAMIYRSEPFVFADYPSGRWWVTPADMLTDSLIRDIQAAGLFSSVFTFRDSEETRFVLEGNVEEFMEISAKGESLASLVIRVVCVDRVKQETAGVAVLQKTYSLREPLRDRTPEALARAMSVAMEKLSKQMITDVYQILQKTT